MMTVKYECYTLYESKFAVNSPDIITQQMHTYIHQKAKRKDILMDKNDISVQQKITDFTYTHLHMHSHNSKMMKRTFLVRWDIHHEKASKNSRTSFKIQWKHHRSWHGIWLVKSCCQYCVSINRVTTFQALWNCPRFPPLGTENDLYRTGDAHVPNVTRSCMLQSVIMRSFADEFFQPVFHLHSYWQLNKKIQKSSNHHSWDDLYREKERPNGTL